MGCDEQDAIDWYAVRGRKKLTTRGLKTIIKEASMLGWPLHKAVRKIADKEWVGFEAAWVKEDSKQEMGFIERHTDTSWRTLGEPQTIPDTSWHKDIQ
jgi:hypothetical protein